MGPKLKELTVDSSSMETVPVGGHLNLGFGHTNAPVIVQFYVLSQGPTSYLVLICAVSSRDCMKGEETENKKIGCTVNLMVRGHGP